MARSALLPESSNVLQEVFCTKIIPKETYPQRKQTREQDKSETPVPRLLQFDVDGRRSAFLCLLLRVFEENFSGTLRGLPELHPQTNTYLPTRRKSKSWEIGNLGNWFHGCSTCMMAFSFRGVLSSCSRAFELVLPSCSHPAQSKERAVDGRCKART